MYLTPGGRRYATQNCGFSLAKKPPKDQDRPGFPGPVNGLSQPLKKCFKSKQKATSLPRPASPKFGSILCLWVLPCSPGPLGHGWEAAQALVV